MRSCLPCLGPEGPGEAVPRRDPYMPQLESSLIGSAYGTTQRAGKRCQQRVMTGAAGIPNPARPEAGRERRFRSFEPAEANRKRKADVRKRIGRPPRRQQGPERHGDFLSGRSPFSAIGPSMASLLPREWILRVPLQTRLRRYLPTANSARRPRVIAASRTFETQRKGRSYPLPERHRSRWAYDTCCREIPDAPSIALRIDSPDPALAGPWGGRWFHDDPC
jgi:hypothetical protein